MFLYILNKLFYEQITGLGIVLKYLE